MAQVRVVVVVNWKRQRVHGMTTDDAKAREWVLEIVNKYRDPLAATMTVDLVEGKDLT